MGFFGASSPPPIVTAPLGEMILAADRTVSLPTLSAGTPRGYVITGNAGRASAGTPTLTIASTLAWIDASALTNNATNPNRVIWNFSFPNASGDNLKVPTGLNGSQYWNDTPLSLADKLAILEYHSTLQDNPAVPVLSMLAGAALGDGVSSTGAIEGTWTWFDLATQGYTNGRRHYTITLDGPTIWYLYSNADNTAWCITQLLGAEPGAIHPGWALSSTTASGTYTAAGQAAADVVVTRAGHLQDGCWYEDLLGYYGYTLAINV